MGGPGSGPRKGGVKARMTAKNVNFKRLLNSDKPTSKHTQGKINIRMKQKFGSYPTALKSANRR